MIDVLGVAIWAVGEIRASHVEVDVWMVVRGTDADAFEFLDPNTDLCEAKVVFELHVIVVAHGLDRRRGRPVLHWVFASTSETTPLIWIVAQGAAQRIDSSGPIRF